ncbi:GAF domain-containing protein [Aeromonas veronii]|uniref:GAF domain-containing protein n=1 Tax=Aeromonas veronii TaxID=654 RepID=UPI003D234223
MDQERIESVLKKNKYINSKFTGYFISTFSIWNTCFAPIIIGLGVSYVFLFKDDLSKLHSSFFIFCFIFLVIHVFLSIGFHYLDKRSDTTIELSELVKKYNNISDDIEKIHKRMHLSTSLTATQKLVIYLTTLKVNSHIREMIHGKRDGSLSEETMDNKLQEFFDTILSYLSIHREVLFSFVSESRYNIALYIYDNHSQDLQVVSRRCDDRIVRQDRSWKPGFGHVGLTHLHKELKICPDITKSSELKVNNQSDKKNYCSFISVPILTYKEGDSNNECLGVLVLTSALPEQFSLERDRDFLKNIVSLIAIYIDVSIELYTSHEHN